jgi:hypothetical protein
LLVTTGIDWVTAVADSSPDAGDGCVTAITDSLVAAGSVTLRSSTFTAPSLVTIL